MSRVLVIITKCILFSAFVGDVLIENRKRHPLSFFRLAANVNSLGLSVHETKS
jgi:hypothetical protein